MIRGNVLSPSCNFDDFIIFLTVIGWQLTVFVVLAMVIGNLVVFVVAYALKVNSNENNENKTIKQSFTSRVDGDDDDDSDIEEKEYLLRSSSFDIRSVITKSFDAMNETGQTNLIRSVSVS